MVNDHPYNIVQLKYITVISDVSDAVPLIIPALGDRISSSDILGAVDALLITGSPSNIEPFHYGGEPSKPGTMHDPDRDDTTLPLIRAAVEAGVPLLAVCRGFQEMNVAFGGTLHQEVHEQADYDDHREDKSLSLEEQYGPAHDVSFAGGSLLGRITGVNTATVNSLHSQGVDRLADGMIVEATAHDGLIEGYRVDGAKALALAVQWHPEWQAENNPVSQSIFRHLGDAAKGKMEK